MKAEDDGESDIIDATRLLPYGLALCGLWVDWAAVATPCRRSHTAGGHDIQSMPARNQDTALGRALLHLSLKTPFRALLRT